MLHDRPHAPQLAGLARRSTSHPSDALPLQSAKPAKHSYPHAPAPHVARALARVAHTLRHAPQFDGSLASVVHPVVPHATCGDAHADVHTPAEHTWPAAQLTPCLLYTSPSPRDGLLSRMPSSA